MGQGVDRKLAAIMAADVVGYSRLMAEDEEGTLSCLKKLRVDLINPKVTEHRGRIVKLMGDGMLVEFPSVVQAVQCAVEIQRGIAESNVEVAESRRINFRVGINLGDIIVEDDDIFGDGVNIAARLEGQARPGGVCISDIVYQMVRSRLDLTFEDLGEQHLKNIAEPIHAWQWASKSVVAGSPSILARDAAAPALPDKPSIAVLPFDNLSGDPDQEYFSDGMTEDVITDLSQISGIFVIARNSSFQFKGQNVDPKQVGRQLGVRYMLEGSVRRAAKRVRINAQLIDTITGYHLWAERFDRDLENVFAIQDEITRTIVSALEIHLTQDEGDRIARQHTNNLEAYDLFLRALDDQLRRTKDGAARAYDHLQRAIALDPQFAVARARLAEICHQQWVHEWRVDDGLANQALELAREAVGIDDQLALAHTLLGWMHLWRKEHVQAIEEARRGLSLDPNSAEGHGRLGHILDFAGRPAEGLPYIESGMRFDPHYPFTYPFWLGHAYKSLQRYDDAVVHFRRALTRNPEFPGVHQALAESYAHLGWLDEAQKEAAEVLRLSPGFSIRIGVEKLPHADSAVRKRVVEGYRKAGLPE